jgi:hypothetical protein
MTLREGSFLISRATITVSQKTADIFNIHIWLFQSGEGLLYRKFQEESAILRDKVP